MVEILFVKFEYSLDLDVRVNVNLPLMGERNLDFSNQAHPNGYCPFGYDFAQLCGLLIGLQVIRRSSDHWRQRGFQLNDLIVKQSVSDLVPSYFSEFVNCGNFFLLNVKSNLYMAAITGR